MDVQNKPVQGLLICVDLLIWLAACCLLLRSMQVTAAYARHVCAFGQHDSQGEVVPHMCGSVLPQARC